MLLTTADRPRSGGLLAADGAVFIDAEEDSERLRELIAFGVPVVAADGAPVPGPKPSLSIDINYDEVIGHLLRSAVASGARRPMLIAPDLSLASSWRDRVTAAFERWCEHLGVSGSVRMFPVNGPDADIIALVRGELEQKNAPDTMIFAGQRLAAVCSAALHIGYADSAVPWISSCAGDPLSEVNAPQISALDTQPHEFGRRSGEALAGLISADKLPSSTHEVWPTRIAWAEHWARVD
ncbi:substrate-binding domain-containing protein [Gulosibacter sediminis]|uniref:substrate-binding domain-containing protein n=1 Tax=Gulosibacter sediminis TaxID=1729695 RepID=UPI002E2B6B72|nr:substrate-binding domain-containing protein [Gulosibacter sediminis]